MGQGAGATRHPTPSGLKKNNNMLPLDPPPPVPDDHSPRCGVGDVAALLRPAGRRRRSRASVDAILRRRPLPRLIDAGRGVAHVRFGCPLAPLPPRCLASRRRACASPTSTRKPISPFPAMIAATAGRVAIVSVANPSNPNSNETRPRHIRAGRGHTTIAAAMTIPATRHAAFASTPAFQSPSRTRRTSARSMASTYTLR